MTAADLSIVGPTPVADGERGSDRIVRTFAFAIGVGGAVYGAVDSAEILHQSQYYARWWTVTAFVLIFGSALVLAAAAFRARISTVRRIAGVVALGYLLSTALAPAALDPGVITAQSTWQYRIVALGAVAAGLAWRVLPALIYLAVAAAAGSIANLYALAEVGLVPVGQDFARSVATAGLFTWVALCANRAGSILDRETTREKLAAVAAAATQARSIERDRFAALVHDGVLSTLLDASRGTAPAVLARQASATVRQLDEFRSADRLGRVDGIGVIGDLREAVLQIDSDIAFTAHRQPGFESLTVPVDTVHTVCAALAESVRNSLRHARAPGRVVERTVDVTLGAGGLRVRIVDDGVGFDPAAVSVDRLGVAFSILGRMRQLPGGAAFVESTPGLGTTVTIVWGSRGDC